MNFLKAIFNNKENKFKVGDSWNDYNFKTFIEFNKLQDSEDEFKREKIYSLFTDTPLDTWLKPHKPELFRSFDEQLNFLSEEPKTKLPTHIYRESKDKLYKINKEFREVKAGRYYNILNYVSTLSEESTTEETLEVMASCIAVCGLDIIYDTEDYEECVEEVLKTMPADEAYTLGCFFFEQIKRIESEHSKNMVNKKPDDAYYQARFSDLNSNFGRLVDIHNISKGVITDSIKVMEFSIGYVYAWQEYESQYSRCEDIYRDLKTKKR